MEQLPIRREPETAESPPPTRTTGFTILRDRAEVPQTPALIIKNMINHRVPGEDATTVGGQNGLLVSRKLLTNEQPWSRNFKATEEWRPLDLGWLAGKRCSLLVIENKEGHFTQVVPTKEQRDEAEKKIVEISITRGQFIPSTSDWLVRPGLHFMGEPGNDLAEIQVRCRYGEAKCCLTIIPE